MLSEIKDYNDVLVLARGLTDESMKQLTDGFQISDLIPIVSGNFQKALDAVEGASNIPSIWKTHAELCTELTVEFAVDLACDLLKVPADSGSEFKETKEVLDAVSGIYASVVAHLQGGMQSAEYLEVVSENYGKVIVAATGSGDIPSEIKGNLRSFIKLVALFAVDFAFKIKASVPQ